MKYITQSRLAQLSGIPLDMRLESKFPTRLHSSLLRWDYTLGDLVQMSEQELLKHRGIGPNTVYEIRRSLVNMGLDIGMKVIADESIESTTPKLDHAIYQLESLTGDLVMADALREIKAFITSLKK
jgi:Bacterial RNA polymerase, alpha chain C terminal domain